MKTHNGLQIVLIFLVTSQVSSLSFSELTLSCDVGKKVSTLESG